jgi:hypothetical protein
MVNFQFSGKIEDTFIFGCDEYRIVDIVKNEVKTVNKFNREVFWDVMGLQVILDNQRYYK